MVGSRRKREAGRVAVGYTTISDGLKGDEKIFISQLWPFEEELNMAKANDDHERIFLLMKCLGGCINKLCEKFILGNPEYSVSKKNEHEMLYLVSPILEN